jgi:hypothetical protein
VSGRLHENVHRFFEGAAGQGASLLSVDAVTGDGHQVTLGRHDVAQQRQVAVVDIGAVEGDDMRHLSLDGFTHSFDAQRGEDLHNVVGGRAYRVYVSLTQHLYKSRQSH